LLALVLGGAALAIRLNPSEARPANALAAGHAPIHASPRVSVTPAPSPTPLEPRLLGSPPFSWDYRWALAHPATGAPRIYAREAILVDLDSHRVLFALNPHRPMAMASTTKLMTAMVALDVMTPDTVIEVAPDAAKMPPTIMGITAGETLSLRELLYGMMLDSGNDTAEAVAMSVGRDAFIQGMNGKAHSLGLGDTHYVNPTGIDDDGQYSSPHDLAVIAAYLYQHYPLLAEIVSTKDEAIPATADHKAFFPENFNHLLWRYSGAIGFKTGQTDNAGYCVVGGARRGNRTLISVVLSDPMAFTDSVALFDYGFRQQM